MTTSGTGSARVRLYLSNFEDVPALRHRPAAAAATRQVDLIPRRRTAGVHRACAGGEPATATGRSASAASAA